MGVPAASRQQTLLLQVPAKDSHGRWVQTIWAASVRSRQHCSTWKPSSCDKRIWDYPGLSVQLQEHRAFTWEIPANTPLDKNSRDRWQIQPWVLDPRLSGWPYNEASSTQTCLEKHRALFPEVDDKEKSYFPSFSSFIEMKVSS